MSHHPIYIALRVHAHSTSEKLDTYASIRDCRTVYSCRNPLLSVALWAGVSLCKASISPDLVGISSDTLPGRRYNIQAVQGHSCHHRSKLSEITHLPSHSRSAQTNNDAGPELDPDCCLEVMRTKKPCHPFTLRELGRLEPASEDAFDVRNSSS